MTARQSLSAAHAAVALFPIDAPRIEVLDIGLINLTFAVTAADGTRFILQRLNPIHAAQVNTDIAAVTDHLTRRGVRTPELIRTRTGDLWADLDGAIWRMLSHIDGDTRMRLARPSEARGAGTVLAAFHVALLDYHAGFQNARLGVHDFDHHIRILREALAAHRRHPRYDVVAPLGEAILDYTRTLPDLPSLPDRVVHGDPKISNFLFQRGTDDALCLVDLDTLARMPVPLELGDALRSWCNPSGEDDPEGRFSIAMLEGAIAGYARTARAHLEEREWRSFIPATERIFIELAARFCADALNESYFGWNAARFASRGEHNTVRALGQFSAARSLGAQRLAAERIVEDAFSG